MVKAARDVAQDPQLSARNFFTEATHPVLGKTTFDSTPIRLERTHARFQRAAPLLGQDNHYVYQELLGLSKQAVSKYIADGIIGYGYQPQ